MKKNVGKTDSYMRFMFGVAFLINIIILEPAAIGTIVLLAIGVILIATALTQHCALYTPLGICSCDDVACSQEQAE